MKIWKQSPSRDLIRLVLVLMLALSVSPALAFNPEVDLTVQNTYSMMNEGKLVLVDVRTQPEWEQTGMAEGAVPLTMQDPEFLRKLALIQEANPGKTLAFICASGRRSAIVQAELARRGFEDVFSVYGGTTGSSDAPGWIAEGLPVSQWTDSPETSAPGTGQ